VKLLDCSFNTLNLSTSSHIFAENCDILRLNTLNSKKNRFEKCKIEHVLNWNSRAHKFINCELNDENRKEILKTGFSSGDLYLLGGFGLVTFFFVNSILQWKNTDSGLFLLISIVLGFILTLVLYMFLNSLRRTIKPNKVL